MRLYEDVEAYVELSKNAWYATFFDISFLYLVIFRLFSGLYQSNPKLFFPVRALEKIMEVMFGVYIPFGANIGGGLIVFHYHGIIINGKAVIGKNCRIYSRVCIGNRFPGDGVPVVQDDVVIGTGACILGPVVIPSGSTVPANSIVTPKNVADVLLHQKLSNC